MTETIEQQQQRVAGYMGAISRVLTGKAGRLKELVKRVELLVMGKAPDMATLMHWSGCTRMTGMPILAFSSSVEPTVPQISLIAHLGGQTRVVENCLLWQPAGRGGAQLVPDGFDMGAFAFADDLSLRHLRRAPATDFHAALPGTERAYGCLLDTEMEQRSRGDTFRLPSLHHRKEVA